MAIKEGSILDMGMLQEDAVSPDTGVGVGVCVCGRSAVREMRLCGEQRILGLLGLSQ